MRWRQFARPGVWGSPARAVGNPPHRNIGLDRRRHTTRRRRDIRVFGTRAGHVQEVGFVVLSDFSNLACVVAVGCFGGDRVRAQVFLLTGLGSRGAQAAGTAAAGSAAFVNLSWRGSPRGSYRRQVTRATAGRLPLAAVVRCGSMGWGSRCPSLFASSNVAGDLEGSCA